MIVMLQTQGMSIPSVEVNMEGIFTSGQAYVALSRATSAEGLTISGYSRGLVFSSPAAIRFYDHIERAMSSTSRGNKSGVEGGEGGALTSASSTVTTSIHALCTSTT